MQTRLVSCIAQCGQSHLSTCIRRAWNRTITTGKVSGYQAQAERRRSSFCSTLIVRWISIDETAYCSLTSDILGSFGSVVEGLGLIMIPLSRRMSRTVVSRSSSLASATTPASTSTSTSRSRNIVTSLSRNHRIPSATALSALRSRPSPGSGSGSSLGAGSIPTIVGRRTLASVATSCVILPHLIFASLSHLSIAFIRPSLSFAIE